MLVYPSRLFKIYLIDANCSFLYNLCLRISIVVIKHYSQKAGWGGKGSYTLTALFIIAVSQVRNSNRVGIWRQELKQRLWRGTAHWLAPHGLLSLLSYRTQGHQPRGCTTHSGLPHQSLIKKTQHRLACSPVLWKHFQN